jgi:hypothetical protein
MEDENQVPLKKPTTQVYTHPYNHGKQSTSSLYHAIDLALHLCFNGRIRDFDKTENNPIVFSSVKNTQLLNEAVGPEQVSAHYENFMVARKFAIGIFPVALAYQHSVFSSFSRLLGRHNRFGGRCFHH